MKKFLVAICALAMMAGAVSCKDKENEDPIEEERVPEYAEGVFNPVMQLSTVAMDSVTIEEYVWEGDQLTSIRYSDGTTVNYTYENGKLSKLTANVEGENEEVRYYYTGNLLASCELDVAGVKMMDMVMKHNDMNRIDSATVTMNIEYLSSLLGDITGKGRVLVNLLGRSTTETLAKMAQVAKMDNSKFSLTGQNIILSLGWNGENVNAQYLSASLEVSLSSADITAIGDAGLFEIPEEMATLLPLIDMMGGLPFGITLTDTVTATYDTYYNPNYCNFGGLLSMSLDSPNLFGMLSLNNVLTTQHNGSVVLSMSFGGQTQELYNLPIADEYNEASYQYNDKKYPTQKDTPEGLYTYTYKN